MKIFRALLCAFLFVFPALAHAQLTAVTATGIRIGGHLIPVGTACAVAVDVNNNPINVAIDGGGLRGVGQSCAALANGAITGNLNGGGTYELPDEVLAGNPGFFYTFTITDTQRGSVTYNQSFQLIKVPNITGASFALDRYVPTITVPTVAAFTFTTGSGAPSGACSGKAFYQNIVTPSAPVLYQCGSDLAWHLISGGGGASTPATTSILKGNGSANGVVAATPGTDYVVPAGNVATATALASTPTQCSGGTPIATGIGASGNANCTAPTPVVLLSTNLISRYALTDGSGTAPSDSSGNSHTGVFPGGGANPTWTTVGLTFNGSSQYFTAPSSRTARTIVWVSNLPPALNATVPVAPQFVTVIGVPDLSVTVGGDNYYGINPGTGQSGGYNNFSNDTLQGTHVWTQVFGTNNTTDPDRLYKDGIQTTYVAGSRAGAASAATADFTIGGTPSGFATWFPGSIDYIEFFSDEKTDAQIAAESVSILQIMQARGIYFGPGADPTVKNLYAAIGDSLTNGEGVAPSSTLISPSDTFDIVNYGLGNAGSAMMDLAFDSREGQLVRKNAGRNVARLWIGTNDVSTLGFTNAIAVNNIRAYCAKAHERGFQTIFSTAIDRLSLSLTMESLNATTITSNGCDLTLDLAANPLLGASGANSSATYFQSDHVHLTTAGQTLVAAAETRALNLLPFLKTQQPSATVTTSTYTMVDADLYLPVSPASNNVAVTLPDCTYFTGLTHSIKNLQASGANTVTVTPASGQTVDGSASAITVANAATLVVKDVVINRSTAGCSWVKVQNN